MAYVEFMPDDFCINYDWDDTLYRKVSPENKLKVEIASNLIKDIFEMYKYHRFLYSSLVDEDSFMIFHHISSRRTTFCIGREVSTIVSSNSLFPDSINYMDKEELFLMVDELLSYIN